MKYLEVEHILEINEAIYRESLKDSKIDYSGKNDYTIKKEKIEKLVEMVPKGSLLDAATYYLKNIILLQPFPNANHRTALLSVEYFFEINGERLEYSKDDIT